jgi:hypothetical protein
VREEGGEEVEGDEEEEGGGAAVQKKPAGRKKRPRCIIEGAPSRCKRGERAFYTVRTGCA